jgi:hypothetical protein
MTRLGHTMSLKQQSFLPLASPSTKKDHFDLIQILVFILFHLL